jgi:hypothetical protein
MMADERETRVAGRANEGASSLASGMEGSSGGELALSRVSLSRLALEHGVNAILVWKWTQIQSGHP